MYANYTEIISQSVSESVSLDELKTQLYLESDYNNDDSYLTGLISVARDQLELATGRSLVEGQRVGYFKGWDCDSVYTLAYPPTDTIEAVQYYNADNELITVSEDDYTFGPSVRIKSSFGKPTLSKDYIYPVRITYTSSITTDVTLKHAVKLLAAQHYQARLPVEAAALKAVPYSLESIVNAKRVRLTNVY